MKLALAEAEALRSDDLTVWEKGDFGQREPEVVLHLPDGWHQEDRRCESPPEGRVNEGRCSGDQTLNIKNQE